MNYQIGDRVAHPLHGAGIISAVEQKRIDGVVKTYYVMRLPFGDMLIKFPQDTCERVGVRPVHSCEEMLAILSRIPDIELDMEANWNKRYRENMLRIRSGDLLTVSGVIKGLMRRDTARSLSTGERKMLHTAKQILASEMALSMDISYDEVEARLGEAVR